MIRRATNTDWLTLFPGLDVPLYWFGFVSQSDYMIEGMGGVFLADDRYWIFVHIEPGVRKPVTLHRMARLVISIAEEAEIKVWAQCDRRFARSATWLDRLGFENTGEQRNGVDVWTR